MDNIRILEKIVEIHKGMKSMNSVVIKCTDSDEDSDTREIFERIIETLEIMEILEMIPVIEGMKMLEHLEEVIENLDSDEIEKMIMKTKKRAMSMGNEETIKKVNKLKKSIEDS